MALKPDTTKPWQSLTRLTAPFSHAMATKIINCAGLRDAQDIITRISHVSYCKGLKVGRQYPTKDALKEMRSADEWAEYFVEQDKSDVYRATVISWIRRIQQDAIGEEINDVEE